MTWKNRFLSSSCPPESSNRGTWLAALWTGVLLVSVSSAADPKAMIDQAYQRTSAASTVDDYSEIIELCGAAAKASLNPEQTEYVNRLLAWAYNRRGELFTEQANQAQESQQTDQARQLDTKALADFEASLQFDAKKWKTWHNRAVSRAISGKYQEAIADFGQVIKLKPDYANAWFNRGEILYDLGQLDEAIADYDETIRLSPTDVGAYSSRGHAFFRKGQVERAITDYNKVIELAPDNAEMLANRGDALQSMGRWLEAAEDLKAALQISGESPRVLQSAAWLMATCPDAEVRNVEYAVKAAEKAISAVQGTGSADFRYLDTLAAAYANAGRFDEAVSQLTTAIQQAPTEQAELLKKRLELYRRKLAYRQTAGEKTAAAAKTKKSR